MPWQNAANASSAGCQLSDTADCQPAGKMPDPLTQSAAPRTNLRLLVPNSVTKCLHRPKRCQRNRKYCPAIIMATQSRTCDSCGRRHSAARGKRQPMQFWCLSRLKARWGLMGLSRRYNVRSRRIGRSVNNLSTASQFTYRTNHYRLRHKSAISQRSDQDQDQSKTAAKSLKKLEAQQQTQKKQTFKPHKII